MPSGIGRSFGVPAGAQRKRVPWGEEERGSLRRPAEVRNAQPVTTARHPSRSKKRKDFLN